MRSLTWKVGLAFLLVSITGTLVAAIFIGQATQNAFQNVTIARYQTDFVTQMADYYRNNHNSWNGVADFVMSQQTLDQHNQGGVFHSPPFCLVDQQGHVLITNRSHPFNATLPASEVAHGLPVNVNGAVVGTVLADGPPPQLSPADQQFLASTERALIFGSLAAFLIALGLGIVLARSLTRPVRELTAALHAMAGGKLSQAVPVRSRDELGQLSAAFNRMSADLAYANQQRRQMTADIAHDLRTPVTVIAGYLEALRDGVLPPSPERFAILYEESQHLRHLIEDLRTLSLVDAGELTLQPQTIAPRALLDRIAAAYHHQADQQNIALVVSDASDAPSVTIDIARMVQVLSNLVSNALRYTPAGGTITLSAESAEEGLQLQVRDTGQGIMPEALLRIFDRFYRADSARSQSQGESGLGLAIAKALVEVHGGQISVASQPGHGATFTIFLPRATPLVAS